MVSAPFSDVTEKNMAVFAIGQYTFLQTLVDRLGVPIPPDVATFNATDVLRIYDPDNVDVTGNFVTNDLDPADSNDDWDENNVDYVGALAAPANLGLFAEGYNGGAGTMTGRIAQKVLIPQSAEVTNADSNRFYTAEWRIYVAGQLIVDPDTGLPYTERFNIADTAELIFNSEVILPSEVMRGISTQMTEDEVRDLIREAVVWARGELEIQCIDPDGFSSLPGLVRTAITLYTRALIFEYDAGAGRKFEVAQEGTKRVKYAGNSTRDFQMLLDRAQMAMDKYLKSKGCGQRTPKMRVSRRFDTKNDRAIR